MTYEEYQERVLGRASHRWHNDKLDVEDLAIVLQDFIRVGNQLDRVKKSLMYGRDFLMDDGETVFKIDEPVSSEYTDKEKKLIHAALGIATEGVELIEAVAARMLEGKPFDDVNLQEEFGDTEWYRAFGLSTLGQSHEDNLIQNNNKLEKRFGTGQTFTETAANNRDLETERAILEGRLHNGVD